MTLTATLRQQIVRQSIPKWQPASWKDYLTHRDTPGEERIKLYFDNNYLLVEMGSEGIDHSGINNLFNLILGFWFSNFPDQKAHLLGGCLLEKPDTKAASPDLVVYLGEDFPKRQEGESRYINLNQWRSPDLVGEISDTTLASDLDEKKKLYAELGVKEYWVIDVRGKRVFAFVLQEEGKYQQVDTSTTLAGLKIKLLEQTLSKLKTESNISAANWFNQAIQEK